MLTSNNAPCYNKNMVIALMGLQGSGKSRCREYLESIYPTAVNFGIKSVFTGGMQPAFDFAIIEKYNLDGQQKLVAFKNLQKLYSVWAETYINKNIWSDKFKEQVLEKYACVPAIMDDARSAMNLEALIEVSSTRPVVIFRLLAPEHIRRQRVSVWRDPNDYTEQLLDKPASLPKTIYWFDIDTSADFSNTCNIIKEALLSTGLL